MASPSILQRFDLASAKSMHVFGGECLQSADAINRLYRTLRYDHRPFLDPDEENLDAKMTEQYRVGYACFKYAVAKVLKPDRIVEIGVGSGVSAIAFAMADESSYYIGLDSGEWESRLGKPFLETVHRKLLALRLKHQIVRGDSLDLATLPECDLVHIDGNHTMKCARHDTIIAWRSGAKWILVDDARDPAVVSGVFQALRVDLDRGCVEWAYFPDTWTGNILIRTDHRREE